MLRIKNYVRPQSLEEAYELSQKKGNVILGGMLWLKMQDLAVQTAIDLCELGLDTITEEEDEYRIGAMVSLRQLETHQGINALTNGAMAASVEHIVGVQFRNSATLGGSLFGRFGFSDVLTLFMVLDAKVKLYHRGVLSISEFAQMDRKEKDLLLEVILPKTIQKATYTSVRNTKTDFPTLTCAVALVKGEYICAVGARPNPAIAIKDEENILAAGITMESAESFAGYVTEHMNFGSNMRGSADYRRRLSKVLVRRALLALGEV